MSRLLHLVIIFSIISGVLSLDAAFIKEYFTNNYIGWLNMYHCFDKKSEVGFFRNFTAHFIVRPYNMNYEVIVTKSDFELKKNMRLGVWIDAINCPYQNVLDQMSAIQAFKGIHFYLMFMKTEDDIKSAFRDVILTVNSNLKIITEDYAMYDVYNPSTAHGGELVVKPYNKWDLEGHKFVQVEHVHMYLVRRNMSGMLFQTKVLLPKEFDGPLDKYLANDNGRGINSFGRFHAILMFHIRDFYKFEYNTSVTLSWGFKQPNGTFEGLVGAIESYSIDFGLSPLFVKAERLPVLTYGRRTWQLKSTFLYRTPKRPASFAVFLRPLDGQVWYMTVVAVVVIILFLKISLKAEISRFDHVTANTFEPSWSHIALFSFGALFQQGCATSPNGTSSRIVFIFIFIFTVLLYQYYSASIVSILILTPAKFIKTLGDLLHSSLVLGCEDVLYTRDFLKKQENDTVVSHLADKSINSNPANFFVEPEKGLPMVAAGGFAYHVETATAFPIIAKTFDEDAICSLDEMQMFRIQQMHQPLRKGSEFKEMLDYFLHRIDETGLMNRQWKHWHARKPECIRSRPETSAVTIEDFYPALSMLMLGIGCSLLVLVIENLVWFFQKRTFDEQLMNGVLVASRNKRNKHRMITHVQQKDIKR